jgi:NAD-dependent deacetylase
MDSEHSQAGDRESQIVQASRWIKDAERIVVLTGAGISTDSGIPDFRGPKGLWTRNPEAEKMATLEHYMNDADVRRRAWQGRMDTGIEALRPNAGHLALVDLERVGNLDTLITQNVDGLHHEAGSDPDHIVEIHGTIREVVCMKCGERGPMHQTLERVEAGEADPPCKGCGGILKSATISFGQGLVADDLERSQDAAMRCDLVLAVGTTLAVYPIANVVPIAKQAGARVIIVNGGPTEMDELADALLRGSISEVLPRLVAANA